MLFNLRGIEIPTAFTGNIDRCLSQQDLLPYTAVEFIYHDNRFIAKSSTIYRAHTLGLQPFVKGGKIHQYSFHFLREQEYALLKDSVMDMLQEEDYFPQQGELQFDTKQYFQYFRTNDHYHLRVEGDIQQHITKYTK